MSAATRPALAGYEHVFEPGTTGWTVLLLHGTGDDEHGLVPLGRQLAPGAALLSPRGNVLENGVTNRFFARRSATDIDVEDMLARSDELDGFIDAAVREYGIDRDRLVAFGFSNGANIALASLLRHEGWARAAALLRPVIYHEPDALPDLSAVDIFVASGGNDPFSPPAEIERLHDVLTRTRATLQLVVDPNAGHGLGPDDLMRAATWFDQLLAP
ncbi:MAG: putative phospholipase/carboxylesterase family protein [Thermoleophilia bacterium]|nr:putative phospholipase/carboxylesterase family protein [Thermoleophilia bacterium]